MPPRPATSRATRNVRRDLPGVFSVIVRPTRGAVVTVPSRHFEAIGVFQARDAEYAAFLAELHRGVAAANPRARFVAGASWLFVFGVVELVFGLALAALFAHSALLAGRPVPRRAIAVPPIVIAIAALFIAQGRAKPYEPDAIPAKFVP